MKDKELNKILRDRARELGLCDKWYKEWKGSSSKQELIEKFLRGIDFCIKNDYPKKEFIKAYFPNGLLRENGVFVDDKISGTNLHRTVLLGETCGELKYDGYEVGKVYVRHQSVVKIVACDRARVFVECYDDTKVDAVATDNARIFVYHHGGDLENISGNVIVRDRQ